MGIELGASSARFRSLATARVLTKPTSDRLQPDFDNPHCPMAPSIRDAVWLKPGANYTGVDCQLGTGIVRNVASGGKCCVTVSRGSSFKAGEMLPNCPRDWKCSEH